jgi:hypothetical protein
LVVAVVEAAAARPLAMVELEELQPLELLVPVVAGLMEAHPRHLVVT